MTPRLSELSRPKTQHRSYVPDRPSPIWEINPAALITTSTPRLSELARHKTLPPQYQPPRPVRTTYNNYQWPKIIFFSKIKPRLLHFLKQLISLADLHAQSVLLQYLIFSPQLCTKVSCKALSARPSPRITQLAAHKNYPLLPIKPQSEWEWSQWDSEIMPQTLQFTPTPRLEELATPKFLPKQHQPPRPTQWIISKATLQHVATDRLAKLAQAKQVPGYQKDYNPRAWSVSKAALLAHPSPCIENLAKPIPRKCRQKKV